jgi:hypothetical protein
VRGGACNSRSSFDLLNRTNYSSVNTVGVIGPPFNLRDQRVLSSQPLAYTAALPRREMQLGMRLNFRLERAKGTWTADYVGAGRLRRCFPPTIRFKEEFMRRTTQDLLY